MKKTNRYGELTVEGLRDILDNLVERGYGNYSVLICDGHESCVSVLPSIAINGGTEVVKFIEGD